MTSRTLPMARSSICCRVMTLVDCGVSRCDSTRPLADRIQSAVYRPEPSVVAPAPSTTTGANCAASAPARRSSKSPSARRCACKEVPASNASNPSCTPWLPCRPGLCRPSARAGSNDSSTWACRAKPASAAPSGPAGTLARTRRGGRGRLCMGLGGRQRGAGQCRHDQRDAGFHAQDARMEGSGRQGHIVGFQAKKIEASPVCQSKTQK